MLRLQDVTSSILAANREENAGSLLNAVLGLDPIPQRLRELLQSLESYKRRLERSLDVYGYDDEERPMGVVFIAPFGLRGVILTEDAAVPTTEGDELGSTSGYAQSLDEQLQRGK